MRGFYKQRANTVEVATEITKLVAWGKAGADAASLLCHAARIKFGAPLSDEELAAANQRGCAGCAWWSALEHNPTLGRCHHVSRVGGYSKVANDSTSADWWCSEWREEPVAEDETEDKDAP